LFIGVQLPADVENTWCARDDGHAEVLEFFPKVGANEVVFDGHSEFDFATVLSEVNKRLERRTVGLDDKQSILDVIECHGSLPSVDLPTALGH
jgi:hypothetical protein